ncbi:nucleolar MIF4G domain-containing protein 1 [Plodia interpunctella]|uniref:nucleolar MIF4G domain-containing protein 1 n=1 Tax=Plodia interpunctella TaxID=58824 RepID=UPI002367A72D|nr:nucleolar MIF4G domain-containing protein 1 [Plodia interpunctella]
MKKNKGVARAPLVNTRKALRKQKRQDKKIHRKEHYLKKKSIQEAPKYEPGRFVKRPADSPGPDIEVKNKKPKQQPSFQDVLSRQIEKEKSETQKLKSQMEKQRKKMLVQANEEEDKIIKKLEKQLGLSKSKNKSNYFADDGLDYLLEICDRATSEQIVAAEKHLANVENESDFEEDLAVVTGKQSSKNNNIGQNGEDYSQSDNEEINEDDEQNNGEFDLSGDEDGNDSEIFESSDDEELDGEDEPEELPTKSQKSQNPKLKKINDDESNSGASTKPKNSNKKEKVISEDDLSKVFSDDEVSHLSGDDDDLEAFSGDDSDGPKESNEKPDVWEDIYGRKRDKEGNIIKEEKGTYIPPYLRNKDSASDKELEQLKRQVKSVLNKLAGTNLHWACNTIESLYSNHSRNSVNTAVAQLWLCATAGPDATPDRMLAEHAALVAVLHANVGNEIGAHFLQELSKRFDELVLHPQPQEDKRLDNIVSCFAHLYCFKLYQASLLYDILNRLLEELSEKHIECVVLALRCAGGVLRKDEPAALRSLALRARAAAALARDCAAPGSRIKFLLEVLMAVKNNNLTKIPNYDPYYVEHLRKLTRTIIRKGNYVTPLNIGLEDLLKADERGKWWVVGSAWEGNQIRQEEKVKLPPTIDQKLLVLARKQRMNTDVRRSIFCVIMAAEDYMDAFEKLQHLGLKGQQEREIVHVLLACCLQEKTYNPYYAVLGQKLCDTDRRYQLSIQFSTWDRIEDIENLPKQSVTNLAMFLVHLIMEKGLPLSVLKIIQFSDLNKTTVRFMRQILLAIIMNVNLESSLEVFYRISKPPKLHMFRESLKLFIQHFLIKNAGKKTEVLSDDDMATLKGRAVEVDKILTMHESKLRL